MAETLLKKELGFPGEITVRNPAVKGRIYVVSIMVSAQSTCPVTWRNSVTASSGVSGNRKCLTVCFMLA